MERLGQELKIIPLPAWIVALLAGGGLAVLSWQAFAFMAPDPQPSLGPILAKVLLSLIISLLMAVVVLLIGYVYADARRRGMRYILWTLLAIFIPNAIGIILYFILRDPLPQPCPKCGAPIAGRFPYCPACGTALAQTCPECRRPVERGWSHCGHCGAVLQSAQIRV